MSEPTVIPPGGGEIIGDSADRRVEILSDRAEVHATWSRFGPGRDGADLHVHRRHSDLFYVLAGELTVRLGPQGEGAVVPAGRVAHVPPLVVHGFRNAGDTELRYLNFHAPGQGFADYMRALRDGRTLSYDQEPPPADGGRPASEAEISDAEPPPGRIVLADVEEIGIAEAWSDPGTPAEPRHTHSRHVESLYVLGGELGLMLGAREIRAQAGYWVQLPPGVPHAFSFPGAEPARYLSVHTPNYGFGSLDRA